MIAGLRVADAKVDLLIRRYREGVAIDVTHREGEIEIVKSV